MSKLWKAELNNRKMLALSLEIMTAQIEIIHTLLEANSTLVTVMKKNKIKVSDRKIGNKIIDAFMKFKQVSIMKKELMHAASEKDDYQLLEEINSNSAHVILYFSMYFRENGIKIDPRIEDLLNKNKKLVDAIAANSS